MRYSITTCICTCFYTDLVNFSNYFKLILFSKSIQETKGSADFQLHSFLSDETLPAVTEDKTKRTRGSFSDMAAAAALSSRSSAPTLIPAVAAAHCLEVLWYDEVGVVSNRDTSTYTQAGTIQHIHSTRQVCARERLCTESTRGWCERT